MSDDCTKTVESLMQESNIVDCENAIVVDRSSADLQGLLLHLTNEKFIDHRDSEVQIRIALCLCYIIKIVCPINPFLCYPDYGSITKKVLNFLLLCIKELTRLKYKVDKLFVPVYTVLSICCEIDLFHFYTTVIDGGRILFECVRVFFEVVKRSCDWADDSAVVKMITDALVNLLNLPEVQLSESLVNYLLNQLVDRCSSKPLKGVLIELFTRCSNKLEDQIQMIMESFLIKNDKEEDISDSSENEDANIDEDEICSLDSYKLIKKKGEKIKSKSSKMDLLKSTIEPSVEYGCHHVFQMIFEVFKINEAIITPLLPTVEMKLRSTHVIDRKRACRLLGKLFSLSTSNDSVNQCSLWETFLGRLSDIELEVREICVRVARDLLRNALENPDKCGIMSLKKEQEELVKAFQKRSTDQEESIRVLIVVAVSQILEKSKTIVVDEELDVISDAMFKLLLHQSRDKFLSVRKQAHTMMGILYRKVVSDAEKRSDGKGEVDLTLGLRNLKPGQRSRVELLLNLILRPYMSSDVEDRIVVERLFNTSLVPYGQNSSNRMRSILQCLTLCDEPSVLCINEMFKTQVSVMNLVRQTVILIGDPSSDQVMSPSLSQKLREKVKKLSEYLTGKDKIDSLTKLFNQARSDKKLNDLLRKFADKNSSRQIIVKTIMDIKKHFSTTDTSSTSLLKKKAFVGIVKCILERGAPIIFDSESVHELLSHCVSAKEVTESGVSSDENIVPLTRTLRLLHTLLVMAKKLVPLQDAYEYLVSVMTTFDCSEHSTNTSEDLCLLVLSKMVECAPSMEIDGDMAVSDDLHDSVAGLERPRQTTLFSEATDALVARTEHLLGYLERCCLKGSSQVSLSSDQLAEIATRKRKDRRSTAGVIHQDGGGHSELCKWRYDCKVAKMAAQCVVGILHCCEVEARRASGGNLLHGLIDRLKHLLSSVVKIAREVARHSPRQAVVLTSLTHLAVTRPPLLEADIRAYATEVVPALLEDGPSPSVPSQNRNLTQWRPEADLSPETQVRIQALKMLSRWVVTLKPDQVGDQKCVVYVMSSLRKYIGNFGTEGYSGPVSDGEMSHLRLSAGKCWLRVAQVQSFLTIFDVKWIYRLSSLIHDPCPQVREGFLRKLHIGLYKLRLPLEYMAMFVFVPKVRQSHEYQSAAKKYLQANIGRRRDFLDTYPEYLSDAKKLFGVLPEYVLSFAIHMLAHDRDWTDVSRDETLLDVKQCLWFLMEPILKLNENYSFIRKLLEKIKHAEDATDPGNATTNQKLYLCSDIALGLLISKQTSFDLKDYPVELKLPRTRYVAAAHAPLNPDFSSLLTKDEPARARIQFSPTPKTRQTARSCMPAVLLKCTVTSGPEDGGAVAITTVVTAAAKPKKHMARIVMGVPEMESESGPRPTPVAGPLESPPVSRTGRVCRPSVRLVAGADGPSRGTWIRTPPARRSAGDSDGYLSSPEVSNRVKKLVAQAGPSSEKKGAVKKRRMPLQDSRKSPHAEETGEESLGEDNPAEVSHEVPKKLQKMVGQAGTSQDDAGAFKISGKNVRNLRQPKGAPNKKQKALQELDGEINNDLREVSVSPEVVKKTVKQARISPENKCTTKKRQKILPDSKKGHLDEEIEEVNQDVVKSSTVSSTVPRNSRKNIRRSLSIERSKAPRKKMKVIENIVTSSQDEGQSPEVMMIDKKVDTQIEEVPLSSEITKKTLIRSKNVTSPRNRQRVLQECLTSTQDEHVPEEVPVSPEVIKNVKQPRNRQNALKKTKNSLRREETPSNIVEVHVNGDQAPIDVPLNPVIVKPTRKRIIEGAAVSRLTRTSQTTTESSPSLRTTRSSPSKTITSTPKSSQKTLSSPSKASSSQKTTTSATKSSQKTLSSPEKTLLSPSRTPKSSPSVLKSPLVPTALVSRSKRLASQIATVELIKGTRPL